MRSQIAMLVALLLILTLLSACGGPTPAPQTTPEPEAKPEETVQPNETPLPGRYAFSPAGECIVDDLDLSAAKPTEDNARVFYEIFVGSFSDSDGDGVGDLRGIINRLDYLNDGDPASGLSLGIEGIWLTPIFPSLSYHKYDVNDYYDVDKAFGSVADLEELVRECHARGIKLILDLPINHTGRMNAWFNGFVKAHRQELTDDPYYDFYSWHPKGETGAPGQAFAQLSGTDDYYECNFSQDMPELNFDNEAVCGAVLDVARYWLGKGVDGFRFDAAKYVYFGDNERSAAFWDWYLGELRQTAPDGYFVAEVWDADRIIETYYPSMDCFSFAVAQQDGLIAQTVNGSSAERYTSYIAGYLNTVNTLREGSLFVPFISNHDMDRAAGYLPASGNKMQMAANLCVLSPGSPFLYYGEELGLRGSRGGSNTDANRRLAMPWGDGDTIRDPEGSSYPADKRVDQSAAEQIGRDDSLYTYYKRLIMVRRANPEIGRGEYQALRLESGKLGGFTSTWDGGTVCVLHNPGLNSAAIPLSELGGSFTRLSAVIGAKDASIQNGVLTIGSQTSVVLR